MDLAAPIIFVAIGFVILLYSGDCLVRGALAAAGKLNVSSLFVGVVIVGFGTSLPEFIIGLRAAVDGRTGLAHGAIVGSNIANIWLVIALPAIIFPAVTNIPRMRLTSFFMLAATAAWIAVTYFLGLNPFIGACFLAALAIYLAIAVFVARDDAKAEAGDPAEENKLKQTPPWRMLLLILIGMVGLPLGSEILVDGGQSIAQMTKSSEILVGITLLAVGSSLPELGAGLAAAWRKESDVALGNILGANIFNILGAGGAVAFTGQQQLAPQFHEYSHWAMGLSALMVTAVIFMRRRIGFATAIVFLALYAVYIFGLVRGASFNELQCLWLTCPALQ